MADIVVHTTDDTVLLGNVNKNSGKYVYSKNVNSITPESVQTTEIVEVEVSTPILYFKRGYYPVTQTFEYWSTYDPNGLNPTGNTLIDVVIVSQSSNST